MKRLILACLVCASSIARADDTTPPEPIWVKSVTATSTYADKHDAYNPRLVLVPKTSFDAKSGDERIDSAWCEGKKDEGIGEALTITFARPTKLDKLSIKAGVWMTPALFAGNNLPTALDLATDDGRTFSVKPSEQRTAVDVTIGGAAVTTLTVKIAAVKKGKMNDSCISQISLGDTPIAVGFDATAAAAFPAAVSAAWAALFAPPDGTPACDAKAVAKFAEFPFAYVELENTHAHVNNMVPHKRSFKTAAAWQAACASNAFFQHGGDFANTSIVTDAPGKIGIGMELAETTQTMVWTWKKGSWRIATFQ